MYRFMALTGALFVLFTATAEARTTVLLFPGGGWQKSDPSTMYGHAQAFRNAGFQTKIVPYPTGSIPAATRHVERVAASWRKKGPVISYGLSAGGTLSASLGARGLVDLAVNVFGPTDLPGWTTDAGNLFLGLMNMSPAQKIVSSPMYQLSRRVKPSPQLLQCGFPDLLVPYTQCTRYVLRSRQVGGQATFMGIWGNHFQTDADLRRTINWIAARYKR